MSPIAAIVDGGKSICDEEMKEEEVEREWQGGKEAEMQKLGQLNKMK